MANDRIPPVNSGNTIQWGDVMPKKRDEQLKLEIAKELGLLEKIQNGGWKSLSAKETGRIGGLLSRKKKKMA